MRIDGACHCGLITYEATINPEDVGICHCTDCQTLSGSAFRTYVLASKDGFRLITGKPKTYVKTSASGANRTQAFCPECGTPIYSAIPNDPQVFSIRAGTVRQRSELIPKRQIWSRSAQAWLMHLESIEDFAEQPSLRL
ncbi:MAG: GFA family protein [Burkholderiales bacterium]|nr:GFA family protein [Burkholderiales bacterium]